MRHSQSVPNLPKFDDFKSSIYASAKNWLLFWTIFEIPQCVGRFCGIYTKSAKTLADLFDATHKL